MSVTERVQDHQALCLTHLMSLRMLAQTEPGTLLPQWDVVEIARATGAVVAEAEAAGQAVLTGYHRGGGTFLRVRLDRLAAAAEDTVAAAQAPEPGSRPGPGGNRLSSGRKEHIMRHQKVRDIMTADPVTVTSATSLKYVAEFLVKQKVSAVPVLSLRGKLLGIVSETDLLRKEELQRAPDSRHSIHLNYRARRDLATAETAGEIMSEPVATVRPDATLAETARLMDRHEVGCLPVVDESGQLLGVVSPRDLLRVFLRPDEDIRAQIIKDVLISYLGTNPALMHVEVSDGVVRLAGELERKSMLTCIWPAVRAVDGVIDADGDLGYASDDTKPMPAPERDESPLTRGTHPPIAARRLI